MQRRALLIGSVLAVATFVGAADLTGVAYGLGSPAADPVVTKAGPVSSSGGIQYTRLRHKCCQWINGRKKCWWVPAGAMCPL